MNKAEAPISLADLSAAGVRLRPYEAVTLVRELLLQVSRGDVAGVPSAHVIRLWPSGAVSVEGPVAAGGRPVARAAQLLDSLLPSSDASQFRVPGGLKLVVARALGTLDLPPFATLESFADALSRFAATDSTATVTNLFATWAESVGSRAPASTVDAPVQLPAADVEPFLLPKVTPIRPGAASDALTVSDIRRARRSTGVPLARVAERSRIPVALLRQLEWGYLLNWPTGHYGRTQLIRYARATGLDEELVVSTISPLLEQVERRGALVPQPIAPVLVERIPDLSLQVQPQPALPVPVQIRTPHTAAVRSRMTRIAAFAIPTLLAISLLPLWWSHPAKRDLAPVRGSIPTSRVADAPASAALAARPSPQPETATSGQTAAPPATARNAGAVTAPAAPARQEPVVAADGDEEPHPAYRLAADAATYSPWFASVSTAVFYHAEDDGTASPIRAETDSRGSVLRITRIVDDKANNFHVRPSPDGSRIAFDSDRDGVRGVYVADGDGKHVRRVSPEGFAAVPSWSPDGRTLAFVRAEANSPQVWNLWTVSLSTGELRQVTRHRDGQPWGGSWFPDGERIAYSHNDQLIVRGLDTDVERIFPSPRKGRLLRTPAVSPDGRRIVFQVDQDGTWLLELRNGAMRKILEDVSAGEYTWAPDGRRVAYHSRKSGAWGVWVMAPR